MKADLSWMADTWRHHHCLAAKLQPPLNHPVLELTPPNTRNSSSILLAIPDNAALNFPIMALLGVSWMKNNYGIVEREGVLDATYEDKVKLENL